MRWLFAARSSDCARAGLADAIPATNSAHASTTPLWKRDTGTPPPLAKTTTLSQAGKAIRRPAAVAQVLTLWRRRRAKYGGRYCRCHRRCDLRYKSRSEPFLRTEFASAWSTPENAFEM